MSNEYEDEFGIPLKRKRGRPMNPEKYRGGNRTKKYRRVRGAWPEAIENMKINDSKTASVHFSHADYTPQKAIDTFDKESRALKKAMNRVRNQTPELRLRSFKITRTDSAGPKFCRIISTTLTRTS